MQRLPLACLQLTVCMTDNSAFRLACSSLSRGFQEALFQQVAAGIQWKFVGLQFPADALITAAGITALIPIMLAVF